MTGLTDRQSQLLNLVLASIRERGYPPTLRELGAQMGIRSTNGVNDHLRALERKGYIARDDLHSRGMRVLRKADGQPVTEDEPKSRIFSRGDPEPGEQRALEVFDGGLERRHIVGTVKAPSFARAADFVYVVRGDSMLRDGFLDGDHLYMARRLPGAHNVVLLLLGDHPVIRKYVPASEHIAFHAANPARAPIQIRRADFRMNMIGGIAIHLYRPFGPVIEGIKAA